MLKKKLSGSGQNNFNTLSIASVIGMHMVSGPLVGAIFGYVLDSWLNTYPWCTIILLLFGIAAGFLNVLRDARRILRTMEERDTAQEKDEK